MVRQVRSGTDLAAITDVLVEEGPPATGMDGFEVIRGDSSEEMLSMMATGTKTMFGVLATLTDLKQGQNQTNETLARMEQGQEDLKRGQAETTDAIKSMDGKLAASPGSVSPQTISTLGPTAARG